MTNHIESQPRKGIVFVFKMCVLQFSVIWLGMIFGLSPIIQLFQIGGWDPLDNWAILAAVLVLLPFVLYVDWVLVNKLMYKHKLRLNPFTEYKEDTG